MELSTESLTIGQLAREAGVGVETLRYYERQKLIPEPPRRRSGYRQYPPETVNRIRFIRRAKELGFSLKEIDDLLTLRAESAGQCAEVFARTQGKIADISQRIASLERMKHALEKLASSCSESGTSGDCPILDALELES
jgi:MerR family mercuric resistance operon transcriptional regulator